MILLAGLLVSVGAFGQSALIDFNTPGQLTNNFSGRNWETWSTAAVWYETNSGGVAGSRAVDGVTGSGNDTTLTYGTDAFDFSADGRTLNVSMMVKIKSPTAVNKPLQLGFLSGTNLSFNNTNPVAFMSVRLGSVSSGSFNYNCEIQHRPASGGTVTTNTSGNFVLAAGNWYRLSATIRNTKGTVANTFRLVSAQLQDFGTSGVAAGSILWTTNNIEFVNADLVADSSLYAGFRAIETAGADALDNLAVWMTDGAPIITAAPAAQSVTENRSATFAVKVDGTPDFAFTWYTNGAVVAGASGPVLNLPAVSVALDGTAVNVAVTNSMGGVESTPVTLTVAADTTAPNVVSVGSIDGLTVGVAFDEAIASAANNPANYSITPAATVTSAALQPDGRRVKLTLASAISGSFSVTASGITDLSGNALATAAASGAVLGMTPTDLGLPAFAGSAVSYNTGDIDEVGGGFDFWSSADQGHVTLAPRAGDFDIQVRVADIQRVYPFSTYGTGRDDFAKAVLMVRESMLPSSKEVYITATPAAVSLPSGGGVYQMAQRTANLTGASQLGSSILMPGASAYPNVWMRLRRVNNTFTAYYSTNTTPTVWYQLSQAGNIIMNDRAYAGVGLTAHYDGDRPASVQFRNFGDWSVPGAGLAILTNTGPITMNVTWPATNGTIALTALATNVGAAFPSNEIQFVWQRADGLGNFTNVPNANANASGTPSTSSAYSSYTTMALGLAESGAQFRVIAKGPGGISATSGVATVSIRFFDQAPPTTGLTAVQLGGNSLSIMLNEPLDLSSVSNVANFVLTTSSGQQIAISGVNLIAPGQSANWVTRLILTTSSVLTNGTQYSLRINNLRGTNGVPIALNTTAVVPTLGTVKVEIFANLPATAVIGDLTNAAKFLSNVAEYVYWTNSFSFNHNGSSFADRSGWNTYGGRISGLFVAPSNGLYRFYMRHDDAGQLWMNTNTVNSWDPAGKSLLASYANATAAYIVPGATNTNVTVNVSLNAGQAYYMEGLWKENSGGDGFSMMFREIGNTSGPGASENASGSFFLPIGNNLYTGLAASPTPVRVELFTNVTGTSVGNLTSATKFINNTPDFVVNVPNFGYNWETLANANFGNTLDNYGARLSAYFLAPTTAVYRFFLKSDDESQFFINTNGVDPAGKTSVAYLTGWRTFYQTNAPGVTNTGCSYPIPLTAGQLYYIEALYKEGGSGDGFAMMYQTYSNLTDAATNALKTPTSNQVALATALRPVPVTSFAPSWPYSPPVLAEIYQNNGSGFGGTAVSDLQNHAKFQAAMPDSTMPMSYFGINRDQPSQSIYPGDNYGVRVSGYFVAPSNGTYRFFIKSDDGSTLFMNTNGIDVAGKVQIASLSSARNSYANNDSSISTVITLTNGQRYYMEHLLKEGTGGDGCAVTFLPVSGTTAPTAPGGNAIAVADFFAPTIGPVTCNNIAMSTTANVLGEGATVTFSVNGVSGAMPIGVQWRKNGRPIPGANGFSYTYTVTPDDTGITTFSAYVYNQISSVERFANLNLATAVPDLSPPQIAGAVGNGLLNEVTVTFSENVLASTATNIANYSIGGLVISGAYLRANNQVALLTSQQTAGQRYTVVVNNVRDTSRAGNFITPDSSFSFTAWSFSRGFVTMDQFTGLNSAGTLLQYLTTESKFIFNTPDATYYSNSFGYNYNNSGGFNASSDQYGLRAYAWFIAPSNGVYRFYIRSDDQSMLFMNTNAVNSTDPAGKVQIAAAVIGSGKNYNDLLGAGPCMSSNIFLTGGQLYYMEALLREGTGNDGFTVAFRELNDPSTPANSEVIPGYFFANLGNPDAFASLFLVTQPANVTVGERAPFALNVAAQFVPGLSGYSSTPIVYQWQRFDSGAGAFVDVPGFVNGTAVTPTFIGNSGAAGTYQVRALASVPGLVVTSAVATVTVTNTPVTGPTVPTLAFASASTNRLTITAQFTESVTAASAQNNSAYTVVDSASVSYAVTSAVLGSDAKTVTLTVASPMLTANSASITLTASGIECVDDAQIGSSSYTFYVPDGFLRFSFYTNTSGGTLPAVFPTTAPVSFGGIFQTNGIVGTNLYFTYALYGIPASAGTNYAVRINGYLIPPSNGLYRFYQASDDQSAFLMNTNATNSDLASGAVRLVTVPGANLGYASPSAVTPVLSLNGGQRYYMEVLLAQGTGGEYVRTAFRELGDTSIPNDSLDRIPALFLSSPAGLNLVAPTLTPTFAEAATNATLGTIVGTPAYVQWYSNNVLITGATNTTLALPSPLPLSYNGATIQVVATNSYSSVSNQFSLTVNADTTAPTIVGVARCNTWTNLIVNFSELVDPLSATNAANYIVVDGAGNPISIAAVLLRPDGRSVAITVPAGSPFDPTQTYYVTNNAITDRTAALNPIAPNTVATYNPLVFTTNFVGLDYYGNISGGGLATLTNDARFVANTPDFQMALAGLEFHATNLPFVGPGNYGTKIFGWFVPPSNAVYRFSFRSDDLTSVFMNTNGAAPSGKVLIGSIATCCNVYTSTVPVTLTAGAPYYVEFLYGQGGGQEYFSATWQSFPDEFIAASSPAPTSPGNNGLGWSGAGYFPSAEIGANAFFGLYADPSTVSNFSFTLPPTPAATNVASGTQVRLAVMATNAPANGYIWYQWQADDGSGNFTNVGPSANYISDYAMLGNRSNYVATFYYPTTLRVVAQLPGGLSITSATATVTVPTDLKAISVSAFSTPATNMITVVFDKPVHPDDGKEVLYYMINDYAVNVTGATVQPDGRTVILGVDSMPASVTVAVDGVGDILRQSACYDVLTTTPFRADFYGDIGAAPGVSDPIILGSFISPANNSFNITAGGSDIFNSADGEYFIGRLVTGNFDIRTRVAALTNAYRGISDINAKAALQARVTTAANSRSVTVNVAPATPSGWPQVGTDRAQMIVRDTVGGGSTSLRDLVNNFTNNATPWLRLVRRGSMFLGYRSLDGVNWTLISTRDTALNGGAYPDTIYVGLAAASHNNVANALSGTTLAQFRDVYFPSSTPIITSQPVGGSLNIGQSLTLSVTADNPANSGILNYQWRKNGVTIVGANAATLPLNNVNISDAANYSVIVANDAGGVVSDVATVTVANQQPLAAVDTLATVQNRVTNFTAGTLLGNDSDPDGRPLSIVAVSGIAPVTFFSDFEAGIPENTTNYGVAHLITGTGVNGSQALALTDATGSQNGGWVINDLVPGRSVSAFSARFKIRLADNSGNAADGLSFNVANDLPTTAAGYGEEGAGSGLTISLDQYNNIPSGQSDQFEAPAFDVKWRGVNVAHVPIVKATNVNWVEVSVNVRSDGTLDLYYTNAPLLLNLQTPFKPIAGAKFGFFARTGGEYETHWLDDVSITVLTPETLFAPAPIYYSNDFLYPQPGYTLYGMTAGGFSGGYQSNGAIRLTDGGGSLQGAVVFDEISSKPVSSFTASFNLRIADGSSEPADGMSFNFADDLPNATNGGAEEGVGTGIALCWDMYRFPDGSTANRSGLKLKYRGQTMAQQQLPTWNTNRFVPVTLTLTPAGTVIVTVDGTNVFPNPVAIGYQPIRGRFGFYARTGGQYASHTVDDLSISLPDYGYVTLTGGDVTYAPSRNVCGTDQFYYQVSDGQGGYAWSSATVDILDVTAPQIIACATNRTVSPTSDCDAVLPDLTQNSGMVVLEGCSLTITQSPLPGVVIPLGSDIPVTLYAVDGVGNVTTCTINVTNVDTVPPVITVADVTIPTAPGACYAANASITTPEATDGCMVAVLTNNAPDQLPIGTNLVVWTAVDLSYNAASVTQVVVVVDTELPQITAPANVVVNADPGQTYASGVALGTPITTENCTIAAVTNDAPAVFPAGVTVVTWTVVDASGNFASASHTVTVIAINPPQITCPADVTVAATNGLCYVTNVALGTPVVTGGGMNTVVTNNAPAQFPIGTNTVTWSALDPAGTNTCRQLVIVTESLPFIAVQPVGTNVLVGSSVSFTVSVVSCSAPLYQWYAGTTALADQTNADLVFTNAKSCDAASYTVVISNAVGSVTSEVAVLVITNAPTTIAPGGAATIATAAECGSLILAGGATYNWEIADATGTAGTGWDLVTAATGIDVQSTAENPVTIVLTSLSGSAANFDNNVTSSWVIASAPDGTTNFSADKFVLSDAAFVNDLAGGTFSLVADPGALKLVFTPNHAPAIFTLTKNRGPGLALQFNIADLLTNSVDADGDSVTFESLGTSTNGATVVSDGTYILYTNVNDVADAFTYTVRDQRAYRSGDTRRETTNTIFVTVNAPAGTNLVIATPVLNLSGKPTLRFSGIPGYDYEVQRAVDLATPIQWTPIHTTNAPAEGYFELTDDAAPSGNAFYRAIRK